MDALRQLETRRRVDKMCNCQEYVDKSGWDAFLASFYVHGGGFFYLGCYFMGAVALVVGYSLPAICLWMAVKGVLLQGMPIQRCWGLVKFILFGWIAYDLVIGVVAAFMARTIRIRSRKTLDDLRA